VHPDHQYEMSLPPKPADEGIRERLAELVEQSNAEGDGEVRAHLHREIERLRTLLGRAP
jgi:hypothetical protein